MRDRVLAAQVDAGEVDLLDALPGVQAGGEDGVVVGRGDARVVEGDVEPAVLVDGPLEERAHRLLVGDVGLDEQAADLVGGLGPGLGVEVDADHLGALGGEPAGGGQADAAARAGDDGHPAVESLGHADHSSHSSVEMKTFLVWVKASRASGPSSRPRPDCLKPPKGVV